MAAYPAMAATTPPTTPSEPGWEVSRLGPVERPR